MKCGHYRTAEPPTPDACARKFYSASACGPQCPDWEVWQAEEAARKAGLIVALPQLSDVGDRLKAILAGYGIVKVEACNCTGLQTQLNSLTREQVLEKIEQLALRLVDNLKRNPNVADNAPVWVRMAVKAMRFDPMDIAAKAMAEKLLRQACE